MGAIGCCRCRLPMSINDQNYERLATYLVSVASGTVQIVSKGQQEDAEEDNDSVGLGEMTGYLLNSSHTRTFLANQTCFARICSSNTSIIFVLAGRRRIARTGRRLLVTSDRHVELVVTRLDESLVDPHSKAPDTIFRHCVSEQQPVRKYVGRLQ